MARRAYLSVIAVFNFLGLFVLVVGLMSATWILAGLGLLFLAAVVTGWRTYAVLWPSIDIGGRYR